jgi:transposase-like protein
MDETHLKIKGKNAYLYRAVDSAGNAIDFFLSEYRDKAAAINLKFLIRGKACNFLYFSI